MLLSMGVFGQCPSPSFTSPGDTFCTGNPLQFLNTTTPDSNLVYLWDFAAGDLDSVPTYDTIGVDFNFTSNPYSDGFSIVEDPATDSIFGFASDYQHSQIVRMSFGTNIDTLVTVETIIGSVTGAVGSDFIKVNGKWFGFVCSVGNTISRLEFDSSLSNTPAVISIGPIPLTVNSYSIVIREEGGKFYGFIADYGVSNGIIRLDFGNQITNTPTSSLVAVNFLSHPSYITIKKFCDKWVGLVAGYGNGVTTQITFDSTLTSGITGNSLGTIGSGTSSGVDMVEEDCNIYGYVCYNGDPNLYKLSYGTLINNSPTISTIPGSNSGACALKCINFNSQYRIFNIQHNTNSLTRWKFPNNSGSNYDTSTAVSPSNIVFTQPGTYKISLTAKDTITGSNNSVCSTIIVKQNASAYFDVPVSNACSNTFTFTDGSSPNTLPRVWNFGDTHTSNAATVTNVYSAIGTYTVTLTITSANGCTSQYSRLVIADSVVANFTALGGCTAAVVFSSLDNPSSLSSVLWNFGDGNNGTTLDTSYAYAHSGTYSVTLTETINGCSSSITHPVNFYFVPADSFSFSTSCLDSTIHFTNYSHCVDTPLTYYWGFGDSTSSALQTPNHIYDFAGIYHDTLICTSPHGCKDTLIQFINVSIPSHDSIIYSPTSICGNTPVNFSDLSSSPIKYWWNLDTAAQFDTSTLAHPAFHYPLAGTYYVKLVTLTGTSCYDSTLKSLYVSPGPTAHFTFDTACLGIPMTLHDSSIIVLADHIDSSFWSFTDTAFSALGLTYGHIFSSCGMHQVIHTVISDSGCIGKDSQMVEVFCPPTAGFHYTSVACTSTPLSFTDASTFGSGTSIQSWNWNFSDSTPIDTHQNPSHSFGTNGYYEIYLTVTNNQGCVSNTDSASIQIFQGPLPMFNIGSNDICAGTVDSFIDYSQPSGLISSWQWFFGDHNSGNNFSFIQNSAHQYDSAGRFIVALTVSEIIDSNLTCYASDTAKLSPVNVHPNPIASFVDSNRCQGLPVWFKSTSTVPINVFGDTINWWSWSWASINSFGDTAHFIFPNPGVDSITLFVQTAYCADTVTQNDTIQPAPTSIFTFTPSTGVPQVPVSFVNHSTFYDSCFWNFGDNTNILTIPNPIHLFESASCDTITLTTKNSDGCIASSYQVLCFKEAVLCLAVDSLSETITGNLMNVQALILNTGTIPIYNFEVMVNVGGSILVLPFYDTLTNELPYTDTFRLNQSFVIDPYQPPTYVCLLAENPNGIVLNDTTNCVNELCLDLSQQLLVFDLYPNPTLNYVTLDVVVPLSSEIIISVYDVTGRLIGILYDGTTLNGYNQYLLQTEHLAKGCYLLTVDFRDERIVKKFNKF